MLPDYCALFLFGIEDSDYKQDKIECEGGGRERKREGREGVGKRGRGNEQASIHTEIIDLAYLLRTSA